MDAFDFIPREMQDPNEAIRRDPVKIVFNNKTCGYYLFDKTNKFKIYFDLNYENAPGSRFMELAQDFCVESDCRNWLNETTETLTQAQNLNYTDPGIELVKSPDEADSAPYIWP